MWNDDWSERIIDIIFIYLRVDFNHKPSFWYFSDHFLKKLIAKPFPFAQSGWQGCIAPIL